MSITVLDADNISYPKLKNINTNSYYCGLIQNIYAGNDSELTAFLQFRYFYFTLLVFNNELATIFKKIAEQDMKHSELLSGAITLLGGDPIYYNAQGKWFSTRNIDYIKNTKQIIKTAIEIKEKAVIDYKIIISKINNSQLRTLLERILSDEENSLEILLKYDINYIVNN